jgi:hypothetical protein
MLRKTFIALASAVAIAAVAIAPNIASARGKGRVHTRAGVHTRAVETSGADSRWTTGKMVCNHYSSYCVLLPSGAR